MGFLPLTYLGQLGTLIGQVFRGILVVQHSDSGFPQINFLIGGPFWGGLPILPLGNFTWGTGLGERPASHGFSRELTFLLIPLEALGEPERLRS